jgi:MFS family permease
MLFLSMPAGVLADRVDRRKLLLTAQIVAAVIAAVLAFLVITDLVRPWHVLVTSFLSGAAMSFVFPTRQALVPNLVPRENVANAVALNSAGQNSTRVLGPSLAGVLIGVIGTAGCFFLQAVSLVWAAALSFRMRITSARANRARASAVANLTEGFRYILGSPKLTGLIGLAAIPTVLGMPFQQMLPVVARDVLHTGSGGLGLLMAGSGVGALAGSLAYAAVGEMSRQGRALIGTAAGFGLSLCVFALASSLPLALVLVAFASGVSAFYMSMNNTLIHMTVTDELRGRVMAVYLMTWGLMPFGTLPMGALADAFGAPLAIAAGGLATTLMVLLIALRLPALREL